MILRHDDGTLQVVNGSVVFRSAFVNKKTRHRQHKRMIQELNKRGYYANGEKRKKLELADIGLNENDDWASVADRFAVIADQVSTLVERLGNISQREEIKHYKNPDTGQEIPLQTLIAATHLWPLDEVLELIP